jgi:hypothetical protein
MFSVNFIDFVGRGVSAPVPGANVAAAPVGMGVARR